MKKLITILCLVCLAFTAFAVTIRPIVNLKPYFMFDNSPASGVVDTGPTELVWPNPSGNADNPGAVNADWYMNRQDYWLRAFERPSILDLGFEMQTEHFGLVFSLDLRQDTLELFNNDGKNKTNIPFVGALIELNFPQLGYIDYTSDNEEFYASIGRRQIKWGPGTYGMAISDSQPYLDSVIAQINAPMSKGWKFWYNFTGIAYKYFMRYGKPLEGGPKSTFAHKFAFENSNFRIAISELNNVYGKEPSLLDFTPCGLWHNNYQDDYSNVMLDVSLEGRIGPVRMFGTFTMDDFDLPHESQGGNKFNSSKPAAIGISAGIELNLLDGKELKTSKFNPNDYAYREDTFKVNSGLNIGYELYFCSKFMYNRSDKAGKFMVPYQFISFSGSGYDYDESAFYLGYKYGPDTLLHRIYVEYTNDPLKVFANAEILNRGDYGINDKYEKSYFNANLETPYDLSGPVTKVLMLNAGISYNIFSGFQANAELGLTKDLTHGTQAFKATVGASIDICGMRK